MGWENRAQNRRSLLIGSMGIACLLSMTISANVVAAPQVSVSVPDAGEILPGLPLLDRAGGEVPDALTAHDVDRALDRPVGEHCRFDEELVIDVLAELSRQLGVSVLLTQSAEQDQLPGDATVSLQVANVTWRTAIKHLLARHHATYAVGDGVLLIISIDDQYEPDYLRTRIFECRELLSQFDLGERASSASPSGMNRGAIGGASPLADQAPSLTKYGAKIQFQPAGQTLVDLIVQSTGLETRGPESINLAGGMMVVKGSEQTLNRVANLLEDIRMNLDERK